MRECISGVDLELDLADMEAFVTILGDSQTCGLPAFPAFCFPASCFPASCLPVSCFPAFCSPTCLPASHQHLFTSSADGV